MAEGTLKLNDLLPHHLTAFTVWFQLICFACKTVILYGLQCTEQVQYFLLKQKLLVLV